MGFSSDRCDYSGGGGWSTVKLGDSGIGVRRPPGRRPRYHNIMGTRGFRVIAAITRTGGCCTVKLCDSGIGVRGPPGRRPRYHNIMGTWGFRVIAASSWGCGQLDSGCYHNIMVPGGFRGIAAITQGEARVVYCKARRFRNRCKEATRRRPSYHNIMVTSGFRVIAAITRARLGGAL